MTARNVPPGWPAQVHPPESPQWERSALGWLLDQSPPEYRGYAVLARHPLALAHLAARHADAALRSTREARATARSDLAAVLPPPAMGELLEALDQEEARLLAVGRGITLVAHALRGRTFVPRL